MACFSLLIACFRTLSTLRHPDLVLFLGASLDSDTTFFLTEYMEGGDVENYMRNHRKKTGKEDYRPPFNASRFISCLFISILF